MTLNSSQTALMVTTPVELGLVEVNSSGSTTECRSLVVERVGNVGSVGKVILFKACGGLEVNKQPPSQN